MYTFPTLISAKSEAVTEFCGLAGVSSATRLTETTPGTAPTMSVTLTADELAQLATIAPPIGTRYAEAFMGMLNL